MSEVLLEDEKSATCIDADYRPAGLENFNCR